MAPILPDLASGAFASAAWRESCPICKLAFSAPFDPIEARRAQAEAEALRMVIDHLAANHTDSLWRPPVKADSPHDLTVSSRVHYVSYGTPGGEYGKECRAAIVTTVNGPGADGAERVGLAVLNPSGLFFHDSVPELDWRRHGLKGGTWHWPDHC